MKKGKMLKVLTDVLNQLPELLEDKAGWKSLNVDDETPKTERIWRQLGETRVSLHRIHPSNEDTFYHPHPWPCAMILLKGAYEMGIGYGKENPPIVATGIFAEGTMYEMPDRNGWHYVKPLKEECYTVMVSGKPWDDDLTPSNRKLSPLSEESFENLFKFFQQYFLKNPVGGLF